MTYASPSTNQVAEAYELLKPYGVPRWVVENALKRAAACDPYPWKAQ